MTSKYHSSKLVLKASNVPLKERVEFMIANALQPIPEHKFEAIYNYLFNEPMNAKVLRPYDSITAYVASKPMFYRTLSDDGRAFLQIYRHQSAADLSYRHSVPTWAMTDQSAAENLSLSLKIYKHKELTREVDLVGFMAPAEGKFYATFGKAAAVDFTLQHESISRVHALFQLAKDGSLYLFDVSTHGTLLNGKQIPLRKYVELKRGDQVRFGHSTRVYVVEISMGEAKLKRRERDMQSEEQRKLREMQKRIEQLTKERDSAKMAEQRKAKQVMTLMRQMEALRVNEQPEKERSGNEERCEQKDYEEDEEEERSQRVTKVRGIDFLANVKDLSKLTVAKLKYYTEANGIETGRVKKAELVKIIRRDLRKHCGE